MCAQSAIVLQYSERRGHHRNCIPEAAARPSQYARNDGKWARAAFEGGSLFCIPEAMSLIDLRGGHIYIYVAFGKCSCVCSSCRSTTPENKLKSDTRGWYGAGVLLCGIAQWR